MNTALNIIFDNQPDVLTAKTAARLISYSRWTIYDMNYRPEKYDIPDGMFLKNGQRLLVMRDKFREWATSRAGPPNRLFWQQFLSSLVSGSKGSL